MDTITTDPRSPENKASWAHTHTHRRTDTSCNEIRATLWEGSQLISTSHLLSFPGCPASGSKNCASYAGLTFPWSPAVIEVSQDIWFSIWEIKYLIWKIWFPISEIQCIYGKICVRLANFFMFWDFKLLMKEIQCWRRVFNECPRAGAPMWGTAMSLKRLLKPISSCFPWTWTRLAQRLPPSMTAIPRDW